MTHMTIKAPAFPVAHCQEIAPLLIHLAGEFTVAIARRWEAPHAEFIMAAAPRRHLICLALAGGAHPAVLPELLQDRLPRAIRNGVTNAPAGLSRALRRMGERAWTMSQYGQLLWALRHPQAAKTVRHAAEVTPELVQFLATLPEPMLFAAARAEIGLAGAGLLRECLEAIARLRGPEDAARLARAWATMSLPNLRKAVLAAFTVEPPPAPFAGTARLRPLASLAALRAAGRRFSNCLREDLSYLADGDYAYYEWLGEPGAIVELYRDRVIGWRFEQARLAHNAPVSWELGELILAELDGMGVTLGRDYWRLRQAVYQLGTPGFHVQSLEQLSAERFGR